MPDLLAFLDRVHCQGEQMGADTALVSAPEARDGRQAELELDLYLWAWRLLHPRKVELRR